MRLGKPALLALTVATSIASAVGTLALDHAGVISLLPPQEDVIVGQLSSFEVIPPAPVDPVRRFAYVSLDAGVLTMPPPPSQQVAEEQELDDEVPQLDDIAEAEDADEAQAEPQVADPWVVETRRNPTAQADAARIGGAYAKRLPRNNLLRDPRLVPRLAQISPGASARLDAKFRAVNANWQPAEIAMVAVKDEKTLELFARPEGSEEWTFIHRYPVTAASGKAGPKLRQGDKQVPEGVYNISFLNPNSKYHVSLRVNYPNAFDREMAKQEGRSNLGGDIMIHGKAVSVGCIAVGDEAAEELFVLAAQTGLSNIKLIIAPTDLRRRSIPTLEDGHPQWLPKLYSEVQTAMADFKAPPASIGLLSYFFK